MNTRTSGLGLVAVSLMVIGGSAVSFAGEAGQGDVGGQLVASGAWGKPHQSVRGDIYEKLKAVPGGPYVIKRGEKVKLDGSGSRPKQKISTYTWNFEPDCPGAEPTDPGGVAANPTTLQGKKVEIVAVCRTKVSLTVSGDGTPGTAATGIRVGGKINDVKFNQGNDADSGNFPFDTAMGTFVFGLNRCAVEWNEFHDPDLPDHWLHKPGDGLDVDTKQVHDPGGPYDGYFYVTGQNLKVTRQLLINSKLLPGGSVYALNSTGQRKKAIEKIVEAALDHERIHGALVKERLKSKKLKFLDELAAAVDTTEDGLQNRADAIIVGGETELKEASAEDKVHHRMAKKWKKEKVEIARPTDGSVAPYTLADIGDV